MDKSANNYSVQLAIAVVLALGVGFSVGYQLGYDDGVQAMHGMMHKEMEMGGMMMGGHGAEAGAAPTTAVGEAMKTLDAANADHKH